MAGHINTQALAGSAYSYRRLGPGIPRGIFVFMCNV